MAAVVFIVFMIYMVWFLDERSSLVRQKRTGTTNMVRSSMSMPPKIGMAIGTIKSDPRPVLVRTGKSANRVVAVVIKQGRTRR